MPYDFNIYHSVVSPSIPDYDTVSVVTTADLSNYTTIPYVNNFGDSKYLSLQGGSLSGDLSLANQGGIAKSLILYSADGIPVSIRAGITFVSSLCSETGIVLPGLLITDGRLDITPDPVFNRAEFRIRGNDTQFNIVNINTFDYYMRVNTDTSAMFGSNTVALCAGAFATGVSTSAINIGTFSQGNNTKAEGTDSSTFGDNTLALGTAGHAEGFRSKSLGPHSHAEGANSLALGAASHAEGNNTITGRAYTFLTYTSATRVFTFASSISGSFSGVGSDTNLAINVGGIVYPFRVLNRSTITGDITADRSVYPFNITPSPSNIIYLNSGFTAHAEGNNTIASGITSHAEGNSTQALGSYSHSEGSGTVASGIASHAEGAATTASGDNGHSEGLRTSAKTYASHAAGVYAEAVHINSWIWRGKALIGPVLPLSSTRSGQFMVSAEGGVSLNNRVGIGTDSIANALTVVGEISATSTVYSSGAPVVVSSSQFETPTTNISAINNIVALTQATYDALTVKLPTTLYVIVSS